VAEELGWVELVGRKLVDYLLMADGKTRSRDPGDFVDEVERRPAAALRRQAASAIELVKMMGWCETWVPIRPWKRVHLGWTC